MSISIKTHKLLWAKSGNRCAFPGCRLELSIAVAEMEQETIVGEEAHIVGKSVKGPRGDLNLDEDQRNEYRNLILLCPTHHKIVDENEEIYTKEKMLEYKRSHEDWVKANLSIDKVKQDNELAYAACIDEVIRMFDFDNWQYWTESLFSFGLPKIWYRKLESLYKIPVYIDSRYWPGRYIELEKSLENISMVLNDFLKILRRHLDEKDLFLAENSQVDCPVTTEKFYRNSYGDQNLYWELTEAFNYHTALIEDLTLELTRAANLLCEKVRIFITPNYRENEGKLSVICGPNKEDEYHQAIPEYSLEEAQELIPYHGVIDFLVRREKRDLNFGKGTPPSSYVI